MRDRVTGRARCNDGHGLIIIFRGNRTTERFAGLVQETRHIGVNIANFQRGARASGRTSGQGQR